jgi:hypothetical protein
VSFGYGVAVRCDGFKVHVKRIYNKDYAESMKTWNWERKIGKE